MEGRFITFEGGDGAGKSTQAKRLADFLRGVGREVVLTREPGGAPGSEEIRRLLVEGEHARWDPLTETLLHLAARREHVVRTIEPALNAGSWVVSDRFADSTIAYQGAGQGLGVERARALNQAVLGDWRPDLTVILDLAPEQALSRAAGRDPAGSRYERMDLEFHRRIRDAFVGIAAAEPERCVLVDALPDPDRIAGKIRAVVTAHFGLDPIGSSI